MAEPEERYRLAAEGLEAAQKAEKAALREYHDARHALIESKKYPARTAAATPGPCPFCGRATKIIKDERYHLDPLAGLKCGTAQFRATREALR